MIVGYRSRYALFVTCAFLLISVLYFRSPSSRLKNLPGLRSPAKGVYHKTKGPKFEHPNYPIVEYFPRAAVANSARDLPSVPPWNKPPVAHVPEATPLFIGFTRNWPLLQQAVVSYITAGWPPEDIYVVENTGTLYANERRQLNESNPFYLDHFRLKVVFGVNIMVTPTLLSFAQLQNLYLSEAVKNNWTHYFWSHMDVVPQSWEDRSPYKSLYSRAVDVVRECWSPGYATDGDGRPFRWALRYLSYDWLTLMNTATLIELGGWDTMISYYSTDCDLHERMRMAGFRTDIADVAKIWDVGESILNLEKLYRDGDTRNSRQWHDLQKEMKRMQKQKVHGKHSRNSWQMHQHGGQGQPFYRDMAGFEQALDITIKAGEAVYQKKWGTKSCSLRDKGLTLKDEWQVEKVVE